MSDAAQATWGGRFSRPPADLMVAFSESVSFDARLAPYDLRVNRAHAGMLAAVGLLSAEEHAAIDAGLDTLEARLKAGELTWDPALEDVHMNLERALAGLTPAADKLHTARSRNDQVATDIRLWLKDACAQMATACAGLQRALLERASGGDQGVIIPGYTHLQRAQPVPLAHHWLAYVEMLERDVRRFEHVAEGANACPLGCGALAGTTLPIQREHTARALGFVDAAGQPRLVENSLDAVADRDVHLDFLHACATAGLHLSRLAEDLILWSTREFAFVRQPDAFATGSSLMPQKKNPDALELIRGKAARLQGHVTTLAVLVKGLPLTYNRDLQEDKPPLFDAADTLGDCLAVAAGVVGGLEVDAAACAQAVADPALLATDVADHLVRQGVPFRQAHHLVGALVARAEALGVPLDAVPDDEVAALDPRFGAGWRRCFDLDTALKARDAQPGFPGPAQVTIQLERWRARLGQGGTTPSGA